MANKRIHKTKVWRNNINPESENYSYEKGGGEIHVQPGQSVLIKDIVENSVNAHEMIHQLSREMEYGEDENVNPLYKPGLDLTDLDTIKQNINELQNALKEHEKTAELSRQTETKTETETQKQQTE